MSFVASGKGLAGFHSAADSFRGDPDWDALWSGHFESHPRYRLFQVSIGPVKHPITEGMQEFFTKDEQYFMSYDSRVSVICTGLTPEGEWMPAAWVKDWGKGKVFYTTLGHDPAACRDKNFQRLLLRGTLWAAGEDNLDLAD
jgi:type 1 glutamine amidotransferase